MGLSTQTATNPIESHFACRPYVETLNPEKKSRNFLSQETFESETILCVNARGIKYKRKFQLICMAHATFFFYEFTFYHQKNPMVCKQTTPIKLKFQSNPVILLHLKFFALVLRTGTHSAVI